MFSFVLAILRICLALAHMMWARKALKEDGTKLTWKQQGKPMAVLLDQSKNTIEKPSNIIEKRYNPKLVLTLGNHENRINRAVNDDPKLDGTIGIEDLKYEEFGWQVFPYLQPVVINGIAYCHYFTTAFLVGLAVQLTSSSSKSICPVSVVINKDYKLQRDTEPMDGAYKRYSG